MDFDYRGPYAYHIIILTQDRRPRFSNSGLARRCGEVLKATAEKTGFRLQAYCFMPDHLHGLVLGKDESSHLVSFVQGFKQRTSFHFKREMGERLWQQSFYDRTLRMDEDMSDVAMYIFENPVAVGMVDEFHANARSGGEYFSLFADGAKAPSLRHGERSSTNATRVVAS
jgi:putative transposase